jgi:deoxyribonuclease V
VTAAAWPASVEELVAAQHALAALRPPVWRPAAPAVRTGGCFVCFARGFSGPGRAGEPGWAGAAVVHAWRLETTATLAGEAGAPYAAGLLALREGPLLELAVRALPARPDVLVVNATGRDHPRRAGLALQLGAVLDLPTIGVTHRPLVAVGSWPHDRRGGASPLRIGDELVGYWVRTRPGTRPVAVSAGWRVEPETVVEVVLAATRRARTPEPLRHARRIARSQRAAAQYRIP